MTNHYTKRGMKLKDKKEVIKHSAAIQVENRISMLQRRAWNLLLANAYDELPVKDEYQVGINELMEILGSSHNDQHLKSSLKGLMGTILEWNVLDKDGIEEWGATTLLAHVNIKNGTCTYSYSSELRRKLYNPKMYARINLSLQNKFASKHTLALYELSVDYLGAYRDYGETPYISLEDFRRLMAIPDDSYPEFKRLRQRVINSSLLEINRETDLNVEVEYKREGRGGKVVALKFKIRRKPKKQLPKPKSDTQETLTGLAKQLHDRSVNPKSSVQLVKDYPEERVQKAINLFDTGVIKAAGGIRRAIEEEWEPSEKQQEQVDNVEAVKEQESLEKQAEAIQMQRTVKALDNFVSKDEWIASVIKRSETARSVMIKQNLATSELSEQELAEIRETAAKDYPESKEAKLEHINRNKSDFGIDTNEIVKELKQEK